MDKNFPCNALSINIPTLLVRSTPYGSICPNYRASRYFGH
jgi:hypothetical protein